MLQEKSGAETVEGVTGLEKQVWSAARGLLLFPAAWALALLGFGLLGSASTRYVGAAFILFGCAVAVVACRVLPFPATSTGISVPAATSGRTLATVGIAGSVVMACLASAGLVLQRDVVFGVAGWLWLGSMALLVVSCLVWRVETNGVKSAAEERWPGWELALFAGLVLIAVLLRLWDLNDFPFIIMGDERTTGRIAIDYYVGRPGPSIFSLLWDTINLPGLWFWTISQSLQAGGFTLWALRLPAALFGAATVIPFYGFVRLAWGRAAAMVGTALLSFGAVDVHFSRITLNNIVTPFFWSVCFFFLLRGLRFGRPVDWAAAGLAGGLSEYGYYGTRLLPFILLTFFAYLLISNRSQGRYYMGRFWLVLIGYVVGFGPLMAQYVRNPGLYTGRGGSLMWVHVPTSGEDVRRMWDTLWSIAGGNVLGMANETSQDAVYHAPLLLLPEAALLAIGFAILVFHWRDPASFLTVVTAVGVMFVGGTLVNYGAVPFISHWTPAFPAFYAGMAVPVARWLRQGLGVVPGRMGGLAPAVVAAGLMILGYMNVKFYFEDYYADASLLKVDYYRQAVSDLEVQSAQAHYQAQLGPGYVVRFFGPREYLNNANLPYLVQGQDYGAVEKPNGDLQSWRRTGKGLAFIFLPGGEQYRDVMEAEYPGGKEGEVRSRVGRHLFYAYVIDPGG